MSMVPVGNLNKYINALLCLAIFFIFTGYVFLNARLKDNYGDLVLLVMAFLSLPRMAAIDLAPYRKFFIALFWAFVALTLASVLYPPSRFANTSWLIIAQYRLVFSVIIICSLLNLTNVDRIVLRWGLAVICLLLALAYLLQYQGYQVQEFLGGISPFRLDNSKWHDKNYAFWQLLLMWGSVALLWRRNPVSSTIALLVALFSLGAVFISTSESSQLAAVLSGIVFLLAHIVNKEKRYLLYFTAIMSFVLFPLLWVCLAPVKPYVTAYLPEMKSIISRIELFDYTASLIKKELVLGYGFGSTLFMPIPKGEVGWQFCFPGGHTHNLVLQFFIDHGLLGLIFISTVVFLFARYLYHATAESPQGPAILALATAGLVLFSLSYSIWKADIVLMYCMWLALVFSISSRHERHVAYWLAHPGSAPSAVFFGVTAFACYFVDYFFLAHR